MSKCNHFWRAVDSTRSQCSKCFEITSPERELKAEIERPRAERDALKAALREFGHHDGRCSITDLDSDGNHCACDCGLSVALGDQAPEQGGGN